MRGDSAAVTTNIEIVWIDDDLGRVQNADWRRILEDGVETLDMSGHLDTILVQENVLDSLDEWADRVQAAPPALVMLDQNLSRVQRRRFDIKGSSLAHLLRLRLPRTPIVCVTAEQIESHYFDYEDLSEYTQVFSFNRLSDPEQLESLFVVAHDYPRICFAEGTAVRRALVDALGPPELDREALFAILPEEFEGRPVHGTTPHRIARWVINILMRRPGFLADSLEVATHLGLTEAAFLTKAAHLFDAARYSGPFAAPSRPRWWASALNDVLYECLPDQVGLSPQQAGRGLPKIEAADFSACFVSGDINPPPDVVAFGDDHGNERKAVRRQFTKPFAPDSVLGFAPRLRIHDDRPRG
jgi:hypothetical protein